MRAPAGLTGNPAVPAETRSDLTADPLQLTPIPAPYLGWGSCAMSTNSVRACGRSPLLAPPASTSAIEHMSLPFDAATRRLFGVPIASTVSQATGVAHVLAVDAVVVDTDSQDIGVQWPENSNSDGFSKNLIPRPVRRQIQNERAVTARRRVVGSDCIDLGCASNDEATAQ